MASKKPQKWGPKSHSIERLPWQSRALSTDLNRKKEVY
jgi:hypothetical protein